MTDHPELPGMPARPELPPTPYSVEFSIEGHVDWKDGDLWPDGDKPERPTIDDLIAMMLRDVPSGDVARLVNEWMIDLDLWVCIRDADDTIIERRWLAPRGHVTPVVPTTT